MTKVEIQAEALNRATTNQSLSNYPAIFSGFMEKGIPESEIRPRENIFTFNAWKALGRVVRKGEHGVKVVTYVEFGPGKPDPQTGEMDSRKTGGRKPRTTTVFHISQTKPLNGDDNTEPSRAAAVSTDLDTHGESSADSDGKPETTTRDDRPADTLPEGYSEVSK